MCGGWGGGGGGALTIFNHKHFDETKNGDLKPEYKKPHSEIPTFNHKHCDETKQRAQWRSEARIQENHKQDNDEPEYYLP